MKKLLILLTLIASSLTYAAPMGAEAVEIYNLMQHHHVKKCLAQLERSLVNVSIDKQANRCPGCNTYTIKAKFLEIDTPRPEKVTVTLKGNGKMSDSGMMFQTYDCKINIR